MSASFEVVSTSGTYRVEIAQGLLEQELRRIEDAIVICDERFASQFANRGIPTISLRAEESTKNLEAMAKIVAALRGAGATRNSRLLAVGGGIVQDVAAFCASIFMRGIRWRYFPTTLLGMADSCIGGKSSINVGDFKNLVGTFHPPEAVLIDPDYIPTLSVEQRVAGLCEAAKICFARGEECFTAYLNDHPHPGMDAVALERIITRSLLAKKWFIEVDEFDRAERLLLNFGHTFGHALESASHFAISHGVAVGVGMLCALDFGDRLGRNYGARPHVMALANHVRGLLALLPQLNGHLRALSPDAALDAFLADKKHGPDYLVVIAPAESGELERVKLERSPSNFNMVKQTFAALLAEIPG